jgi:ABC-type molybdate transport system ATPase subunit
MLVQRFIAEWHIPTLLVSHDEQLVRTMADRIVEVCDGRVVATPAGDRGYQQKD